MTLTIAHKKVNADPNLGLALSWAISVRCYAVIRVTDILHDIGLISELMLHRYERACGVNSSCRKYSRFPERHRTLAGRGGWARICSSRLASFMLNGSADRPKIPYTSRLLKYEVIGEDIWTHTPAHTKHDCLRPTRKCWHPSHMPCLPVHVTAHLTVSRHG